MNGISLIIFAVLFLGFFVGLGALFVESSQDLQYNQYYNSTNYTETSGEWGELPDAYDNEYTWYSFLTSTGDLMPDIPGFNWFFASLALAIGITAFIVVIRGAG